MSHSRRHSSGLRACVCTAVFACAGTVHAAPVGPPEYDLFDHLATTFPIEDWIMRARSRYDALERRVPETSPRNRIARADSTWSETTEAWPVLTSLCLRSLRTEGCRLAIVNDPCGELLRRETDRPELPDHLGIRTLASLELGAEFE